MDSLQTTAKILFISHPVIPFSEMPPSSRVWIYQGNRLWTEEEDLAIRRRLKEFVLNWSSHGAAMDASATTFHRLFVVLTADESRAPASGCGIDKSVHFVQELERKTGIRFFDRQTVAYWQDQQIVLSPMSEFWALRKAGRVTGNTLVFNNLVRTLGELEQNWLVPFSSSWHEEMWAR